jgi:hypothetical protein
MYFLRSVPEIVLNIREEMNKNSIAVGISYYRMKAWEHIERWEENYIVLIMVHEGK